MNPRCHPKKFNKIINATRTIGKVFALCTFFFSATCTVNTEGPRIAEPAKLLPDSVYIPLLANIQLIQVWNSSSDTMAIDSIKQILFVTFGVDEQQFLESHRYYQSDFEGQRARLDSVKILIETEKRRIQEYKYSSQ
tara:strand:- start:758 stop:1168 length:411 start_codon:yes stop_codon:yes gene_type:complete